MCLQKNKTVLRSGGGGTKVETKLVNSILVKVCLKDFYISPVVREVSNRGRKQCRHVKTYSLSRAPFSKLQLSKEGSVTELLP